MTAARLVVGLVLASLGAAQEAGDCPADLVTFEVITGFVYTAPQDMLDSQPGTLILNDCIETCRANSSCKAINFETGLCVLFSSSADENKSKCPKVGNTDRPLSIDARSRDCDFPVVKPGIYHATSLP